MEDLKKYEMCAILSPDLTEKERDKALEVVGELLTMKDGKIEDQKAWGMRDLAYRIKKNDRGYYHLWHFRQDGVNIGEIERELSLDPNVIRHMIVSIKDDEKIEIFSDEEPKKPAKREKKEEKAKPAPKKKEKPVENIKAVEEKLNKIIDGSDISL